MGPEGFRDYCCQSAVPFIQSKERMVWAQWVLEVFDCIPGQNIYYTKSEIISINLEGEREQGDLVWELIIKYLSITDSSKKPERD